jgi:hypothetical protein
VEGAPPLRVESWISTANLPHGGLGAPMKACFLSPS